MDFAQGTVGNKDINELKCFEDKSLTGDFDSSNPSLITNFMIDIFGDQQKVVPKKIALVLLNLDAIYGVDYQTNCLKHKITGNYELIK